MSRVCPDHPHCHSTTWICKYDHTQDIVIYSKFQQNPFRHFGDLWGSKLALSHYFGYWLLQQLVLLHKP